MTKQEKEEFQHLKQRVAYLEGILVTLQGKQGCTFISPPISPTVSPTYITPTYWYGPYPEYKVTC